MTNHLYYGDNLGALRESVRDESVDLIYLDPPFNSNAAYNILFRAPSGEASQAQIEAFEDTWHWNDAAERAFDDVMQSGNAHAAEMLCALRSFLRDNDVMAYITHISVRMLELHRVLKPAGSIYLHCDPTASHYLKVMMDAVFGKDRMIAEIVWRRTNARGTTAKWPRLHDIILHYGKSDSFTFNTIKVKADVAKTPHTLITGADGLKYQTYELTGAGTTREGESGKPWKGFDPNKYGRHWGYAHAQLDEWDKAGEIHWPRDGGFPRRLDKEPFDPHGRLVVLGDVWTDIDRINQSAKERLGYPTQKPLALLERILSASSNEGEVVLDPFCGCGTTVHAAEKLKRQWIGIDVTHLAISVIEKRLRDAFPGIQFAVHGSPKDLDGARDLVARDKYQFQWWAVSLVNAAPQNSRKKGADGGIDGVIYFRSGAKTTEEAIVSVKGGGIGVKDVRELTNVVDREKAKIGVFISLEEHTQPMVKEAAGAGLYEGPTGKVPKIQLFTIEELLGGKRPRIPLVERAFKVTGVEDMEEQDELDL
jgi:site-specific DNA-methyltransferase (adenine-specific)